MSEVKIGGIGITVRDDGSLRVVHNCAGRPGKGAKQSFAFDSDPNELMRKYAKGADVSAAFQAAQVEYADVSQRMNYQDALNVVCRAEELFDMLPSVVRQRFAEDPGNLAKFLADKENLEESYKLGLRVRPKVPEPEKVQKVEVVVPVVPGGGK